MGELPADLDFTVNLDGIKTAKIAAGVSVHDPSLYKFLFMPNLTFFLNKTITESRYIFKIYFKFP
mgnify:CR=1 FL=1